MRRRSCRRGAGLFSIVIAGLASLGCTTPYRDPCVPGGEAGSSYKVPLLERYTAEAKGARWEPSLVGAIADSCQGLDGLSDGQTLSVQLLAARVSVSTGQTGCWTHLGETPPPAGWTFTAPASIAGNQDREVTIVSRAAQQGSCTGWWYLTLEQTGDVFAAPAPGAMPPMLVRRHFSTERAQDCPLLAQAGKQGRIDCEDLWISRLLP